MYKTAQEVANSVLVKIARVNPGILRRAWRSLFGHGYEDDLLRAKLQRAEASIPGAAPKTAPAPATAAETVADDAAAAAVSPEVKKKGMGLLGTGALVAGGGGLGYLLANSKPQADPSAYPQNYPMPQ